MSSLVVWGQGFVGLQLAVALSKKYKTFGYDISNERLGQLRQGTDIYQHISSAELAECAIQFTNNLDDIKNCHFFIVAVPTPANMNGLPHLKPLIDTTKSIAKLLHQGDIVVYESTVYPGATEEICIPILERYSRLKCGSEFQVGYSPERINPGDKTHTLANVPKIIAAQNQKALEAIKSIYASICQCVIPVSSIKIAEACKSMENTQRDINIAFMNEFAKIMHAQNIDVDEVIKAAKTKWNHLDFIPGLVGGHCIAVDPYYLAFKAKRVGVNPTLILTSRQINDSMTQFIIQEMIKIIIKLKFETKKIKIGIFGVTYKENTSDLRNSLVIRLIKELMEYNFTIKIHDPLASKRIFKEKTDLPLQEFNELDKLNIIIIAVAHDFYKDKGLTQFIAKFKSKGLLMDIPNLFTDEKSESDQYMHWSL